MAAFDPRLGFKIRAIREEKRLTQSELAQAVGVTQHTISRLENAHVSISLDKLQRVADALGVSISFLFEFDGDRPTDLVERVLDALPEDPHKLRMAVRDALRVLLGQQQ